MIADFDEAHRPKCVMGETNITLTPPRRPTPMPLRWCAYIAWCVTWVVLGPPMAVFVIISVICDGLGESITRWHRWLWEVAKNGR